MSDNVELSEAYNLGYSCAKDMAKDEIERLRAENEKLDDIRIDYICKINKLVDEREMLRRAMHDIYEVYAGYDGILIETSRDYLKHLIIEMANIAAEHKK